MVKKQYVFRHFTINQAERIASDMMVEDAVQPSNITFDIVGPTGRLKCRWLDPYLGFFQVDGKDGFFRVADFEMNHNLHVEAIALAATDKE